MSRRSSATPFIAGIECSFLPLHDVDVTETGGHQDRVPEDCAAAARVTRQIRYPIRWHRVEAVRGHFDWSATDAALAAVQEAGLEPIVDLVHHTSYPTWLTDGFRDRRFGPALVRYVEAVAERYPWLTGYTVLNEPLTTLLMAGQESVWPPFDSGLEGFARLATNVLPALSIAAARCRELLPEAAHVWVDTCEHHAGLAGAPAAAAAYANDRRHAVLDLAIGHQIEPTRPFLAALLRAGGESLLELEPLTVDVVGLDYYWQHEWWYDEAGAHSPSPHPAGFAALAEHYSGRYGVPVMLAETNVRGTPTDRASWLRYTLDQYEQAGQRGVDLRGYCWYPFVDSCDWDSLLARGAGRVDPVGVLSLDPHTRDRVRTPFTEVWEAAACGTRAADLPAYRFQPPLASQLVGYQSQMADWPWIDPAPFVLPAAQEFPMTRSTRHSAATPPARSDEAAPARDLVVLSHLRWTWVWQRPQHLISRLAAPRHAAGARTWFVEEPVVEDVAEPAIRTAPAGPGITRVWLAVPSLGFDERVGFSMAAATDYPERLAAYLARARGDAAAPDVWLYTPMAYPLLQHLEPHQVIYDVMDDLASFAYAPPGMKLLFLRLLDEADLVFTGGRSLHRSVAAHRTRDCHLFASGVDVDHYARSLTLRRSRQRPVAGYVGVLDERLDLALIAALAEELPDWTLSLVGPSAKIQPEDLPGAANMAYPGQVTYEELPAVMAGFDVALMPFALNEATRSISPTKTLEYLAAGLPVVSTRVPDVVADYTDVVQLADTAAEFAAACRRALAEGEAGRAARLDWLRGEREWSVIAARMDSLMAAQAVGRTPAAVKGATA